MRARAGNVARSSWSRHVRVGAIAAFAALSTAAWAGEPDPNGRLIDLMRHRILAHLAPRPGTKVAEIGVGGGWFVLRLAESVGPDGVVYGTDIDSTTLETLRRRLPELPSSAARVDLRLCGDERDTALDDLGEGSVDVILMIDSLCFDRRQPHERNVAYLGRFRRILRPGGRLAHHMDCTCDTSVAEVVALFRDAGFSPAVETLDVSPDPKLVGATWPCRSEAERERHAFVGIFRRPDSPAADATPGATGTNTTR